MLVKGPQAWEDLGYDSESSDGSCGGGGGGGSGGGDSGGGRVVLSI